MTDRVRWAIVVVFATAMAWVEAASVLYIRALVGRIEPYQANPLPISGALGNVELWREASTLVMLATLGLLAGRTWRRRAGYAALAFGVWDIFYYVFLRLMSGWPKTLLDWDILFLLPLPWWGPVLAPVTIALVMIVWGTLATQSNDAATDSRWARGLAGIGIVLALTVFMTDAWLALPAGRDAVLQVLPTTFNWALFGIACVLIAAPALHQLAQASRRRSGRSTTTATYVAAGTRARYSERCARDTSAPQAAARARGRRPSGHGEGHLPPSRDRL